MAVMMKKLLNTFLLCLCCAEIISRERDQLLTFPANIEVPKPNKAIIVNDHLKLAACATKPMSGGPSKKPRKLMLETAASAKPGDIFPVFPASPNTNGTTQDTPIPINKQPVV